MSTYTQILYQVVFRSKYFTEFLTEENKTELFDYIAGIIKNRKSIPYKVGGYGNHLHLIIYLHPTEPLSGFVREVKRSSHNWMIEKKDTYKAFSGWQVGYGAFTYNHSSRKNLVNYVKNQFSHHENKTFQDEYISILKQHEIEFELKYLFV